MAAATSWVDVQATLDAGAAALRLGEMVHTRAFECAPAQRAQPACLLA